MRFKLDFSSSGLLRLGEKVPCWTRKL